MLETMLSTHSTLNYIFIAFVILGFLVPVVAKSPLGFKKASFIYTMVFQALISMIAFSGIVALVSGDLPFTMPIIAMIAVFAAMMGIEISKHKRIKKGDTRDEATFAMLRSGFRKASVLNLIILVGFTVFMIAKSKGI
ncbi:MAG: Unknown protein [uncultured Sulfurovum sp.]|uniref:DUF4149 domain-containing protein n=1 Tax=uncultured Sulfurovum sp. TaxID=269237 RepID=A0A6S6SDZ1_9BACT|nr:MAG: Unknown protein [uncultured Sulfurovum sp.]